MRPRRLELEGFSTFRDRVVLDFDGLDLVAFTGATGAGKSTLIDAITFALYGSVARFDNTNRVAPVIHQLANEARVRLDFDSGGRTYIATRVVRRRSSKSGERATTREARLERIESGDLTTVVAGDVKELNREVEDLLGLDFAQFTRTIVLPQGEFAAFLRDEPANRDKLLQRLLDLGIYERMGQLARSRAKEAGIRAEMYVDQRRRLDPPPDERMVELTNRANVAKEFIGVAETRVAELSELDAELDPLRQQVLTLNEQIGRLESFTTPAMVDGLDRDLRAAGAERERLEAALVDGRAARDEAQARLNGLPDKATIVRLISVMEQLAEARADIEDLEQESIELADRTTALQVEQERLEIELAEAEADLRSTRQAADAAEWTAALELGRPCPVCSREVEHVPDHDAAGPLEAAEEHHRRIGVEAKQATKDLAKVTERGRLVAEEVARNTERIELLDLQRSTVAGPDPSDDLTAALPAIAAAESEVRETTELVSSLEQQLSQAVGVERDLAADEQRLRVELGASRDGLADLGPPVLTRQSLLEDYRLLACWTVERAETLQSERDELASTGKRLARQRAGLVEELAAAAGALGLEGEPANLVALATAAEVEAATAVADAQRRRDEDRDLAARLAELEAGKVLDEAMGRHLRSGGFGSWLLGEALDSIVAKATGWLFELSDRRYSLLAGDNTFVIVDHHNADESRDVRTLSGGETFLASLSLALALADSIAELAPVDAPQLDSMFLDEGFGTLDPATLDVVAGAIEELASAGRMIGIVTHVGDLAERMPAQFQVRKGPTTSTVELVTG